MGHVRVVSHSHHFLDGFEHSPQAFYGALDVAPDKRRIPDAERSRVAHSESGLLSGTREYLRVVRDESTFDICAAPFGSGFFVSWWLARPSRRGLLYLLLVAVAVAAIPITLGIIGIMVKIFGFFIGFLGSIAVVFGGLAILGYAIRQGFLGIEEELRAVPILGAIYDWFFKPDTYYRNDSATAFESAVTTSIREVLDEVTKSHGVRAASDLEPKPILREFAKT